LIGGFGNWFVPLQIGAPDMAFPSYEQYFFLVDGSCVPSTSGNLVCYGRSTGLHDVQVIMALHAYKGSIYLHILILLVALAQAGQYIRRFLTKADISIDFCYTCICTFWVYLLSLVRSTSS
jgi:heme/copper-type cytochrome/quinol oxidase subunit 1